jgi:hypothetical protein
MRFLPEKRKKEKKKTFRGSKTFKEEEEVSR